jgi:molybdopterin molybdotransferase
VARQADLLSVSEARQRILARFSRLNEEVLALDACLGRALARAIDASTELPPFNNSSMDGFALRAAATSSASSQRPAILTVASTIAAGSVGLLPIEDGEAARIMTGAPLPPGADAVVPFEDVDDRVESILVKAPVPIGACVRPAGQDVKPGVRVLDAGTELGSAQIALLAALGAAEVCCIRRPEVAILATGDELAAPGVQLRPGQIYNSNVPMLAAAVVEAGGKPRILPTAADEPEEIAGALAAAGGADLLITSGGASVGDFDHVKAALGASGELGFWRVRVRPGKPLIFGSIGELPLIGLPGNPTSAMVTFEIFARPAIRTMLGLPPFRPEIEATVEEVIDNHGGRETYARVRLRYEHGAFYASLAGPQDSAMLVPLARADGLLRIAADVPEVHQGDTGSVLTWRLPAAIEG